ncbi:ABC transporter substrate-binding protein [Kinneretia asaccharophila]|uniref:ABC-type transport system substrate-binding protein n=1 Tax=Roseateles asaccharophilus TaxID=582607 RepID=A0A4R6NB49_9BURK|nr:ABC transporter substrate-binding protein [Roseateles asaccharophilus]MDN3543129.1 ABC transporter substrate-binding protein [Roseateles asaccharophilus]TDP13173.1 ABC-type transport system substrate-binding protein [Roseateles asaccharophilus]
MKRRQLFAGALAPLAPLAAALLLSGAVPQALANKSEAPAEPKVLRYAFLASETGFDPAQLSDLYSRIVTGHLFEGLYKYDYLARPYKIKPNVAADMPEVSADYRTWTIKLKPGIFFTDDPVFKGKPRELVAEDFVYAFKRFFDPATKSPVYAGMASIGMLGVDELRQAALKNKKPFDYDTPVEGLRALDRYTLQIKLKEPRPRLLFTLADNSLMGAVAREVVEHYGDKIMEHPVGTGPFKLKSWRRSSQIVLERNPSYRELVYDAEPNADDARAQEFAARFKGRRLPMLDEVHISIIEESQPRWLAFLNGEFDLVSVPLEFSGVALPHGKLAPNLAKRGVQLERVLNTDRVLYYFNMEDAVVGGYTADKVALRRAISLATDVGREIRLARRGQAIVAQSVVAPFSYGYDPEFKTENSDFDLPRAKALLEMYGYKDRDGDGWRELPDGKPLEIEYASQPDALSRQFDELWKKNMDALGVRFKIKAGKWPEQLKSARAGQLQIWQLGYSAASPDVQDGLQILNGPDAGGQNLARFRNDRFDAIYKRMQELPDGPERLALLREAQRITVAFMPQKYTVHRIINDLSQPWLIGYKRPPFGNVWWQYVDIDESKRETAR